MTVGLVVSTQVIKLYAWEKSFKQLIQDIRGMELAELRKVAMFYAFSAFQWLFAPFLVSKDKKEYH